MFLRPHPSHSELVRAEETAVGLGDLPPPTTTTPTNTADHPPPPLLARTGLREWEKLRSKDCWEMKG